MSEERLAEAARGHLSSARRATDEELTALARTIADVCEHDHGADGLADIFCLNAKAWMGGFTAVVVRRLLDTEAERDKARADLAEQTTRNAELIAEMQRTRNAADDARAELEQIRRRDEPIGSVLYDVIRRAITGDLDDHEAVRQIEQRLIQPFVARMQEAKAKAGRSAGRRQSIGQLREELAAAHAELERLRAELAQESERTTTTPTRADGSTQ